MGLLKAVVDRVRAAGLEVAGLDVTVIAETVRVGPHREAMRGALASVLGMDAGRISVKATSTDGMGFTGRDEGMAAAAVATLIAAGGD